MIPVDLPSDNLAAHAKLWVFAECYDIATLKQRSLFKVHRDLCAFHLGLGNATAFVDTIDFVYGNTAVVGRKEDSTQVKSELREVVLTYAVCYADVLVDAEDFLVLLQGGGDFAGDFARAVTKRNL